MVLQEVNRSVFAVLYEVYPRDPFTLAQLGGLAQIARLLRNVVDYDFGSISNYVDDELGREVALSMLHDPENGGLNNYLPVNFAPTDSDEICTVISGVVESQVLGAAGLHRQITEVNWQLPSIIRPKGYELSPGGQKVLSEPWKIVTIAGSFDDITSLGIDPSSPTVESMEPFLS